MRSRFQSRVHLCAASLAAFVALAALESSCSQTLADSGLDADLRIEGAQFYRGSMPSESGGPAVVGLTLETNGIRPGGRNKSCVGALGRTATAAAITLDGDSGYWIVPAGAPDVQTPEFPSFSAPLSFSQTLAGDRRDLVVRAVDADGHFGLATLRSLTTVAASIEAAILAVSLRWDTESDLDLHVVDPLGVEIWKRNINSYERPSPGKPADPEKWKSGGILDFDSNAQCTIDGLRRENVTWAAAPPSGHYLVRVDTFSLCNEVSAHWSVEARFAGRPIGAARGTSLEFDTRMPHDRGAGVIALEFDIP